MSTFNGWPIISLPASPAPKSIEWSLTDNEGANRSPFSYQQQIYDWGQAILRASVSYPPMPETQAAAWEAFLAGAMGIQAVFLFGDSVRIAPQNGAATGGTTTGSNPSGSRTIGASSSNLTPGDWIAIGLRLYRVVSVSGGNIGIWPPVREAPANGTSIVIANTQGLFRLQKNTRKYNVNEA